MAASNRLSRRVRAECEPVTSAGSPRGCPIPKASRERSSAESAGVLHSTTVTILRATKTPLQTGLVAVYSEITARKGGSALQLSNGPSVQRRAVLHRLHRTREGRASGYLRRENVNEPDESYI